MTTFAVLAHRNRICGSGKWPPVLGIAGHVGGHTFCMYSSHRVVHGGQEVPYFQTIRHPSILRDLKISILSSAVTTIQMKRKHQSPRGGGKLEPFTLLVWVQNNATRMASRTVFSQEFNTEFQMIQQFHFWVYPARTESWGSRALVHQC